MTEAAKNQHRDVNNLPKAVTLHGIVGPGTRSREVRESDAQPSSHHANVIASNKNMQSLDDQ